MCGSALAFQLMVGQFVIRMLARGRFGGRKTAYAEGCRWCRSPFLSATSTRPHPDWGRFLFAATSTKLIGRNGAVYRNPCNCRI